MTDDKIYQLGGDERDVEEYAKSNGADLKDTNSLNRDGEKKERISEDIQKHKNGMFYCQITDNEYPYGSALGWGVDEVEAKMNAWSLRKQIIEAQLTPNPSLAVPIESYKEFYERRKPL